MRLVPSDWPDLAPEEANALGAAFLDTLAEDGGLDDDEAILDGLLDPGRRRRALVKVLPHVRPVIRAHVVELLVGLAVVLDGPDYLAAIEARLAKWQAHYDEEGVESASPVLDRILAEQEVAVERAHAAAMGHGS